MNFAIIFRIRNRQEDYAECFRFYNQLFWDRELTLEKIPRVCAGYFWKRDYDRRYPYDIERYGVMEWNSQALQYAVINPAKLRLHFQVCLEEDQDIVNFIYFFASRQAICTEMSLVIDTKDMSDDMKIGEYLYFLNPIVKNSVFIRTKDHVDQYNVIHHLPGTVNDRIAGFQLTKFLPLLEISEETYQYLSSPVSRLVPKGCMESLRSRERRDAGSWEGKLMDTCKRLFTRYSGLKSTELFYSEEFYSLIKNIPVLTFLFLCAFRNHCAERRSVFDIEELKLEISDARDFSEGILQIIENIVFHSQHQKGYFSFRIHDRYVSGKKEEKADNIYLKKEYGNYITKMDVNGYETYLELFVVDSCFSGKAVTNENILCRQFIKNLQKRGRRDGESQKFVSHFQKLSVADFFMPDKWKVYYEQADNIIEHYGIQLFDKIVTSCDGLFELISTSGYTTGKNNFYCSEEMDINEKGCIAGTQYKILLPLAQRNFKQEYTGVDFTDWPRGSGRKYLGQNFSLRTLDFPREMMKEYNRKKAAADTEKESQRKLVEFTENKLFDCYKRAKEETEGKSVILQVLLADIVGVSLIEIVFKGFLKALVKIREFYGMDFPIYLVFGNLSQEFVSEFSRLMGIYYYKVGKSQWMRHTQLYFWTKEFYEDLIIAGECLSGVREYIFQRAALKGIYPSWLFFLNYIWKKCMPSEEGEYEKDEILPYEVLAEYNGETLFQHIVNRTVQTEIYDRNLGCCMKDIHVQLGARVHVMKFFDGQTLFLNNYFSSNYAYIVVKRLYADVIGMLAAKEKKKILLIGYESYSEMLLVEVEEMLQNLIDDYESGTAESGTASVEILPYIIAENVESGMAFRAETGQVQEQCREILQDYDISELAIVLIIPINSTLTTFSKVIVCLNRLFEKKISNAQNWVNFAVIVLRDNPEKIRDKKAGIQKSGTEKGGEEEEYKSRNMTEIEETFWKEIDEKNKVVRLLSDDSKIQYLTMVPGEWELPLECTKCFPQKYIHEKPLVKTNRSGLSPMIQIGKKQKGQGNLQKENMQRLNALSDVLIYKHVYRKDNHYLYYFDTNQLYSRNKTDIEGWLTGLREKELLGKRQYHFIVSPLHDSNAGFVESVNRNIFGNTAHIIRLEFNKMYRSNFRMQYSYLRVLYSNLLKASLVVNDYFEINFYFVDDEIVSGKTFLRAKSLLQSLLMDENNAKVKINIFQRIYVLIDRLSDASKDNYISNKNYFYSYVKFNISAIQNHDDFCYMCTLVKNAERYKYMSATNEMDRAWKDIESKFQLKKYTDKVHKEEKEDKEGLQKYRNRMLAAHYAEAAFQTVSLSENMEKYCECIIRELLYKRMSKKKDVISGSENNRQIFTSYIKILSRPFLVYKSEVKEAALRLLLIFMEVFLGEDAETLLEGEMPEIYRKELLAICRVLEVWRERRNLETYKLLIDFMEQLTDMDSTYIIRQENIEKIFRLFDSIAHNIDLAQVGMNREKFELQYTVFIKQLTSSEDDETKSMRVEKLFLTGCEGDGAALSETFIDGFGLESDFGQKVLIENTKVIYDAVKYLAGQISEDLIQKYIIYLKGDDSAKKMRILIHEKFGETVGERLKNEAESELQNFRNILTMFGYNINDPAAIRMINAQCMRYILMFREDAFNADFDKFYKELYLLYRESGDAGKVQLLMIQNEEEGFWGNGEPYVIFDDRNEDNGCRQVKLVDQPLATRDEIQNCKYQMDTYYIDREKKKVILKYDIGKSREHIYAVLQFDNMQDMKKVVFLVRLLLIYRSRTRNRMKQDFGNHLFQNLCQAKQYATFLEHFKNVTHSDPEKEQAVAVLTTILNKSTGEMKSEQEKYYIATCYKLLADINISTLYHNIIANKVMNNTFDTEDFWDHIIFRDTDILRKMNGIVFERSRGICSDDMPEVIIHENLKGRQYCYLGIGVHCTPLLILSVIQNAYKYGDNSVPIEIWYEQTEKYEHKLEYLCVSNGFTGEREKMKTIFRECIMNPIGRRKLLTEDKEGITLFSINVFCQTLFREIFKDKKDKIPEQMLEVCLEESSVVVKLPIMGGRI